MSDAGRFGPVIENLEAENAALRSGLAHAKRTVLALMPYTASWAELARAVKAFRDGPAETHDASLAALFALLKRSPNRSLAILRAQVIRDARTHFWGKELTLEALDTYADAIERGDEPK